MTVQSETARNDYTGAGTTDTYDYTFRIYAATDLRVTQVDTAGVETQLSYPTDYSVTDVGSFSGGTIVLTAGNLPAGYGLTLRFKTPLTQGVDLRNQTGFYAQVVEDALDRLTKIDQQQQDEIDRSVLLPETETGNMVLPTITERANAFLAFDANGDAITGTALTSSVPATAFAETLIDDATAGEMVETLRNGLTAETTVVNDDEVLLRDTSATTGKRITVRNLMKVITELATETAPDAADEVPIYDASAGTADKVTLTVLAEAVRALLTAKSGAGAAANYSLSAAVAGNALTITLKAADGTALSATNKAQFTFRDATAATGTSATVDATADLTLTVSSGSTLGSTSAVPMRGWVVLFNDAGTLRLGVVNCSTSTAIYPLSDDTLASATAEGGAGAADSAGVIYAGATVTTKAMRVLGYFEATEATAGTWATAPSKVQLWQPGMKLPGDVVQIVRDSDSAYASGTTIMPSNDTIPQNTEGDEYLSQAITPTSAVNLLDVRALWWGSGSIAGAHTISAALFQDSTANALAALGVLREGANRHIPLPLRYCAVAGSVSATTFKVRAGLSAGGTTYFNGAAGARRYGGVANSYLEVREIMG